MSLFMKFIAALPDLIKLFVALEKRIQEQELKNKVADDLKTIHGAFSAKDPSKLTALFNS